MYEYAPGQFADEALKKSLITPDQRQSIPIGSPVAHEILASRPDDSVKNARLDSNENSLKASGQLLGTATGIGADLASQGATQTAGSLASDAAMGATTGAITNAGGSILGSAIPIAGSAIGGAAGSLLAAGANTAMSSRQREDANVGKVINAASSGVGAGVGSIFGPVGTLAGGAVGTLAGAGINYLRKVSDPKEKTDIERIDAKLDRFLETLGRKEVIAQTGVDPVRQNFQAGFASMLSDQVNMHADMKSLEQALKSKHNGGK